MPAPLAAVLLVAAGSLLGTAAVAPVWASGTEVRVLLLEARSLPLAALDRPLVLRVGTAPGGSAGGRATPLALLGAGEQGRLRLDEGRIVLETAAAARSLPVPAGASALWLEAAAPSSDRLSGDFQLQQSRYRGGLQVRVEGTLLQAINHLPLELYLPSVVGSEMPASWPQAALRAQAVAARTYALRQRRPSALFDLSATVSSQVYKGVEAETASTREAVAATRGQVLVYGGQLANTVFHSSSGGSTENSGDLWTQQLPYLVSVPDFDQASPVHTWEQRFDPSVLLRAFRETGGVDRIEVLATTGSGRVRQARVVGPRGTLVVTGPQLRSRLGLRSTQVRFQWLGPEIASAATPANTSGTAASDVPVDSATGMPMVATEPPILPVLPVALPQEPRPSLLVIGRGFGHGVGMSQWGAHAMALRGMSYRQILGHYYRGTSLSVDGVR
ncbi:MAG: SpoIID/LytB domain-containing protein [Cyanobium sp.]|nr:SpoIID/LytB domain-containing protein [Cyanobium sp.]